MELKEQNSLVKCVLFEVYICTLGETGVTQKKEQKMPLFYLKTCHYGIVIIPNLNCVKKHKLFFLC